MDKEELDKIVAEHKIWLETKGKSGKRAIARHLRGAKLNKADLRGANLLGADLREADLTGADLREAHMFGQNYIRTDLRNADLSGAYLSKALFYKADLSAAKLIGADLNGAVLMNANLRGSDLHSAKLIGADLRVAGFKYAKLIGADFTGAKLIKADLYCANLTGANLSGTDLELADLSEANVTIVQYDDKIRCLGVKAATCYGRELFKRFLQDKAYLEEYEGQHPRMYRLWELSSKCGQSMLLWAFWSFLLSVIFAVVFFFMGPDHIVCVPCKSADAARSMFDFGGLFDLGAMVYYSVITFTTLGFGDVTPTTPWGMAAVTAEVIVGYVMLGGLISILANKLARRS